MSRLIALAVVGLLLAGSASARPLTKVFTFTAQGFEQPGAEDPVTGSVTVAIDLQGETRSGPVEAVDLTVGGVAYTPETTTYVYDPSVDRLSVHGQAASGPASFDLEVRKTSTANPGPNDFSYTGSDGGYHIAGTTTVKATAR